MMKRTLIVGAVLAAVASVACGAQLIAIAPLSTATNATSTAVGISQDGLYVGGRTTDPYDGNQSAGYYNLSTSTWTTVKTTNGTLVGVPASGYCVSPAHVAASTSVYVAGNMNDNGSRTYTTSNQYGRWYTSGNTAGNFSPGSSTMVGDAGLKTYTQNSGQSCRATADGTDAWITGTNSQGTTNKGANAFIWKQSTGNNVYTTITGRNSGTKVTMCSVASNGRAVGYDSYTVARTAGYVDATNGSTQLQAVGLVPGYNASQDSYAWGISENGNYITGRQTTTTTTRPHAFLWKVGDATATILPDLNGNVNDSAGADQEWGGAVADDGCVVGYAWLSGISKNAAIWFPGTTKAQLLWDVATAAGIDLTGWTTLGTGAAGIEKVGNQYYITGNGTYNGYARGYVLVIPEPATMALLALGGLAMLRRRR